MNREAILLSWSVLLKISSLRYYFFNSFFFFPEALLSCAFMRVSSTSLLEIRNTKAVCFPARSMIHFLTEVSASVGAACGAAWLRDSQVLCPKCYELQPGRRQAGPSLLWCPDVLRSE